MIGTLDLMFGHVPEVSVAECRSGTIESRDVERDPELFFDPINFIIPRMSSGDNVITMWCRTFSIIPGKVCSMIIFPSTNRGRDVIANVSPSF
jgi:hypothetical protein